jgi:hypothetical protein
VTTVTFLIKRDTDGTSASTVVANDAGTNAGGANAVVRVRLEGTGTPAEADWQGCVVVGSSGNEGRATCTLVSGAQMAAADLGQVNIIAFDRN